KSKTQFNSLTDEFILSRLNSYILTNGDKRKQLEKEYELKKSKIHKSKKFKELVKAIREELGVLYGSYHTSQFSKKEKYLEENKDVETLITLHKSSHERKEYYYQIYSKIFSWYQPTHGIADLACGLNPLSYSEIENKELKYFVSDLNPKDMEFLQEFFNQNQIKGKAIAYDITKQQYLEEEEFKQCDVVFFFKALDSFETIKKNISKEILQNLPQRHIVVSFPTKSLGSKKEVKSEKRNWLRNFMKLRDWTWEEFEVDNELFFLIEK
ncbi:MAG: hypothetical protein VX028_02920, partial [Nanoarchaeota archaeon]|nr:hypothetical protein [Nanoarchaeota archaeon]